MSSLPRAVAYSRLRWRCWLRLDADQESPVADTVVALVVVAGCWPGRRGAGAGVRSAARGGDAVAQVQPIMLQSR